MADMWDLSSRSGIKSTNPALEVQGLRWTARKPPKYKFLKKKHNPILVFTARQCIQGRLALTFYI